MLILEELESAQRRNANIIAEMVGYGMSGTNAICKLWSVLTVLRIHQESTYWIDGLPL